MDIRKRIAKNTTLQIILNIFNLLAGIYSLSLIVKYLGKTAFGKYGFISSFYFYFLALLDFGVSTIILREVSSNREKTSSILNNLLTYKLFLSIFLVLIAVVICNFYPFPKDLRLALIFYSPILVIIGLESIQIIFEADLRYEYIVLGSFFWRLSALLFVIIAIRLNLGLVAIALSFVSAESVRYLILYLFSRKFVKIKIPTIEMNSWLHTIKAALPLGVSSVLGTIIRNTDVMILTKTRGFAEVGLYLASYRLCDMSLSLPLALMGSIFPLMSKFYKQDFNLLKLIYQKTFDILSLCGVLLVVLVLALSDKIIIQFFGNDYIKSAISLRILIFSALSVYLAIGSGTLLIATNRQRINMWFFILGAPLSIILNLILIPRFGFIGAAISNAVVMVLIASLTFCFATVKVKISVETTKIKKAILAGLVTLSILFCFRSLNLFISTLIGIWLYVSLAILLKAIDMNDIISLLKRQIQ